MNELRLLQEVLVVFCDSQSVVHLTKNSKHHSKTKHIDIRRHFIRDIVAACDLTVEKVHTTDNPGYMLTKPLSPAKFDHCLNLAGIIHT